MASFKECRGPRGGFLADNQNHQDPPAPPPPPKKKPCSTVMGSGIAGSEMESPVDPLLVT